LVAATSGLGAATATGSSKSPPAGYPAPVASHGGALTACPNPAGLEPFDTKTASLAVRIASSYDRTSLANDLRQSDRSWWPQVREMWRSPKSANGVVSQAVYRSGPAEKSAYSVIVRFSCGANLIAESLTVGMGPHQTRSMHCSACVSTLFFVNRRGRPLIYYLY
jgi:hypothetical protein